MSSASIVPQQPPTKKVKREHQSVPMQKTPSGPLPPPPNGTSNVVFERVYFSYQTKGVPHQNVFYAIPQQHAHTHMHAHSTAHHSQQSHTNGHGANGQHHQFSYTPQSDDNINQPLDSSSPSGDEPVLDLWDPAAIQHHEDHWGNVLDIQARDSLPMPGFNPNFPQANLQFTQYAPDDVTTNLPFPQIHQ